MNQLTGQPSAFFEGQLAHLIGLLALLVALGLASLLPGFGTGSFLGVTTPVWVTLAVADAVLHQVYVWLCWRLELHGQRLTGWLGPRAFPLYKILFAILIILRPVLIFALGWANRGSLPIAPWLGIGMAVLLLIPALYLMMSIRRYFSFDRAFGIDHFDPAYRDIPLVRKGIFRWSPNAMYVFGFLGLWVPAFLFQSVAALMVAAFSHLYIWVHYYCTERPDMRRIYG